MYLKKIELLGFKSFAERTSISFERGVTAIVGPNGCGKSNISDGIRWVLGEKSAKLLRGGKMEDLIFAGTDYRKPLGFAEVALTISNEDKLFPIEYEEVVIARRLYRNGESEYLLNKTPCRLKDIQDLIMNTGIGSNAYSMVEQGEIDYIVQAKADERRFLVEEAAGISKYKNKKEEALRKLERTEHNLQRVNDIISEIEKNIKYAERQAKRAARFRQQFDRLKSLEIVKAGRDLGQIRTTVHSLSAEKEKISAQEKDLQAQVQSYESRLHELEARVRTLETQQEELDEKKYRLKTELTTSQDKYAFNTEKRGELTERNRTLEADIATATERIEALRSEIKERERSLEHFYGDTQTERERLVAIKQEYDVLTEGLAAKKKFLRDCQDETLNREGELTKQRNEYHKVRNQLTGVLHKKERIQQTWERLGQEEVELQQRIEVHQAEDVTNVGDYTHLQTVFNDEREKKSRTEEQLRQVQESLLEQRGVLQEIDSKMKALEEVIASLRQVTPAREDFASEGSDLKMVCDVLEIRAGFERAIQAALAECLSAIIVESYSDACGLLTQARERKQGSMDMLIRARLPKTRSDGSINHDGIIGKASQFVSVKHEIAQGLLIYLDQFVVVEDIERLDEATLELLGHYNIVSKDGTLLKQEGVLRWRAETEFLSGVLAYEERSKALSRDRERVRGEVTVLSEEEAQLRTLTGEQSRRINELQDAVVNQKITIESNEKMGRTIEEQLAKVREHQNVLEFELSEANEEIEHIQHETQVYEQAIQELESVQQEKNCRITAESTDTQAKEKRREELQVKIASLETTGTVLKEKEEVLKNAVTVVRESCAHEEMTKTKNEKELQANRLKLEEIERENTALNERVAIVENESTDIERALADVRAERSAVTREREREMTRSNQLLKEYSERREALHAIELKEVELSYQQNAIRERMAQSYKVSIDDVDVSTFAMEDINFETLDHEIDTLRKKVESLGTVNLLAIEEHKELQDRFAFLSEQKTDLEHAQRSLLEVIRKISRTTKQLFIDVFAQVQKNFQHYFLMLFEGGVAELVLVDETNPLESGIDIIVRPPGKKLQNVSLLSGGEKALTATALLFALFKVKPSPFCILDEVDAPLDEANIDRFLNVIREFLNNTQFIIVTHNRKTIAMADILFGVTMEEAGVSKIVSVRVSDVETAENIIEGGETHQFNKKTDKVDNTIEDILGR